MKNLKTIIAIMILLACSLNLANAESSRVKQLSEDSVASYKIGRRVYLADRFSSSAKVQVYRSQNSNSFQSFLYIELTGKAGKKIGNSNSLTFSIPNLEFDKKYKLYGSLDDKLTNPDDYARVTFSEARRSGNQVGLVSIDNQSDVEGFIQFTDGEYNEETREGNIIGNFNLRTNVVVEFFRPVIRNLKIDKGLIFIRYKVFIDRYSVYKEASKSKRLNDLISAGDIEIQSVEVKRF